MSEKLLKELQNLIGDAYCRYNLSEEAFDLWVKMLERESK